MKIVVHPADREGASAKYRLVWPAEELQKHGHDISIEYDLTYQVKRITSPFGYDPIVGLDGEVDGDVIVMQRPLAREYYDLMRELQKLGKAVVIELDDAFHCLPPHNPVRETCDPIRNPNHSWKWLERACAEADWVTCTTEALADHYGAHGRVSIIPNYMRRWYTEIPRPASRETPVIGWTGSVKTHARDLHVTKGAIGRAIERVPSTLAVVGTGVGVANSLQSVEPESCGWVSIDQYPIEMAKFDVGIVPLKLSPFNDAKSALKLSEFGALGIACIASPTPDNKKANDLGIGVLAHSPEEWEELAVRLLSDRGYRDEMGERSRQIVKEHLVLEDHADEWLSAWSKAYDVRRGGVEIEEGLAAASHG